MKNFFALLALLTFCFSFTVVGSEAPQGLEFDGQFVVEMSTNPANSNAVNSVGNDFAVLSVTEIATQTHILPSNYFDETKTIVNRLKAHFGQYDLNTPTDKVLEEFPIFANTSLQAEGGVVVLDLSRPCCSLNKFFS